MSSPTARSLAKLRKEGWVAGVVERYCSFTRRRHDLFGFIDIIAVRGDEIMAVQATSDSNIAARMKKAVEQPAFPIWMRNGRRFEVWGWGKKGAKGKRKLWTCRVITPESKRT